jgi:hypothetical protein
MQRELPMITEKKMASKQLDVMKKLFGELLPVCGVCNGPISGHMYKQIAVTPIERDNPKQALALIEAVKRLDWEKLLGFQKFNGLLPAVVVYAVKCPDNTYSLAAILNQFELWEPDQFLHQELTHDCARLGDDGFLGPL